MVKFLRGDRIAAFEFAQRSKELELGAGQAIAGFGAGLSFRHRAYAGELAAAKALLAENRMLLPRNGEPSTIGSWAMLACVIEGLAVLSQWDATAELYPLARQLADTGAVCIAWISRFTETVAGIAASAACDWDGAERYFDSASRQAARLPYHLELAEIDRFRAAMLLKRAGTQYDHRAAQLLRNALKIYRSLGMAYHVEISENLLASAAS